MISAGGSILTVYISFKHCPSKLHLENLLISLETKCELTNAETLTQITADYLSRCAVVLYCAILLKIIPRSMLCSVRVLVLVVMCLMWQRQTLPPGWF